MKSQKKRCPGCRRESCDGCGIYQKLNTNKQVRISFPEGFEIQPEKGMGISFDVGTTSLAGMLWDLEDGTLLSAETGANPQASFGADVISRIQSAVEDKENLIKMQKLLVERLDEMAEHLVRMAEEDALKEMRLLKKEQVRKVTFAGNTAMCEILLGIKPQGLSQAPFQPDYFDTELRKGGSLGFRFLKEAQMIILPPVGGFVGADAMMVYSYVNLKEPVRNFLAVDIGTNGEIILQ